MVYIINLFLHSVTNYFTTVTLQLPLTLFSESLTDNTFLCLVGAKGGEEAAENRTYLAGRMIEEVTEIIRVLQVLLCSSIERFCFLRWYPTDNCVLSNINSKAYYSTGTI